MKKRRSNKGGTHPYSSDKPISSREQDVLGRAKFAERLAYDVMSWDGQDSLVIGLYGSWGSGKTSLKNMILEVNSREHSEHLPVMEFNPWQLSGTGGIPVTFFRELGFALGNEGTAFDRETRAKKLEAYGKSLSLLGTTLDIVGNVMPLTGIPGGALVKGIGKAAKKAGTVTTEGSGALKSDPHKNKSLEEQKKELTALLSKLSRPLLVVIDDIDRLATDEILQVFQLVKANADFPRVIYLLLFEREIVSKALDSISGGRGNDFLEKIVQVGYHIPLPLRSSLQKVLFNGLDKQLGELTESQLWDKHRWSDLYEGGISGYFKNLRHAYRFLASFGFHVRHHKNKTSFEVNPIDLIGLECLRVFEPSLYEALPGAKWILLRHHKSDLFGMHGLEQTVVEEALRELISKTRPENRQKVRHILQFLFPQLSSGFQDRKSVIGFYSQWLRNHQVCHSDIFDKYFTLSIANDDLSQTEIDLLLSAMSDSKRFFDACTALKCRGLLKLAFERLDAYKEQVPIENMEPVIVALCDMSDDFPKKRQAGLLEHDINTYAWRLVYFRLKLLLDRSTRFEILHQAFLRTSGIALPVEIVSLDERVGDREARGHEFLLENDQLMILKGICVDKIRKFSKTTTFKNHPELLGFLFRWREWSSPTEVKKWISEQLATPQGALWLLAVILSEAHSYGRTHEVEHFINLATVELFADVPQITDLIEKAGSARCSPRERIALREFHKALKRRAEGKPDNSWRDDMQGADGEIE